MLNNKIGRLPIVSDLLLSHSLRAIRSQVIVVGGGHAGCEAAYAASRTGADTLLVTQNKNTIGEMSCNPSIGGIGKGTLVREIDALGGLMGRIADQSSIQFKVLNKSKGPAVYGPRAQMDRDIYKNTMLETLKSSKVQIYEGSVSNLHVEDGKCKGIVMKDGEILQSDNVVLTTGTFLGAKVHIGMES